METFPANHFQSPKPARINGQQQAKSYSASNCHFSFLSTPSAADSFPQLHLIQQEKPGESKAPAGTQIGICPCAAALGNHNWQTGQELKMGLVFSSMPREV